MWNDAEQEDTAVENAVILYWERIVSRDLSKSMCSHSNTEAHMLSQCSSKAGVLIGGAVDTLGWAVLDCGSCPEHCGMLSDTPDLYHKPVVPPQR